MTTRRNLTPIAYTHNLRNPSKPTKAQGVSKVIKNDQSKAIGIYQKTKLLSISVRQCHNLHKEKEEGGNVV